MMPIVDLHMHVVPGEDDGSRSVEESLRMLKMAEEQGVANVFCTSHSGCNRAEGKSYYRSFDLLNEAVKDSGMNVRLHKGCEVLCEAEYMDGIIHFLDEGIFATLGDTKCVLIEFLYDVKPNEAIYIVKKLVVSGYKPIIAHMERDYNIPDSMVGMLIKCGALIQVNAFSFIDNYVEIFNRRAKELLKNRHIHFIGSDAHRIDHRAPTIDEGVKYILHNTDEKYAIQIINGRFLGSPDEY
jgi:protein-tyrosine phosphatase